MNVKKKIALSNVDVIDVVNEETLCNQTILIDDGLITAISNRDNVSISQDYEVHDLTGKTVIPGLIDSHLHLLQSGVDDYFKPYAESFKKKLTRNMMQNLNAGITTVRNMPDGNSFKVVKYRNKINNGTLLGPRILTSGPAISPSYGYFSTKMFFPFPSFFRTILKKLYKVKSLSIDVDTKEDAIKAVHKIHSKGADFIKTITPGPFIPYADDQDMVDSLIEKGFKKAIIHASMSKDVLKTIVDTAHSKNMRVAAHNVYSVDNFSDAVSVGIDSLEHTPFGIITEETFDRMKELNTFWVPTAYAPVNYLNLIKNIDTYDTLMATLPEPFFSLGKNSLNQTIKLLEDNDLFQSRVIEDIEKLVNEYIPKNIKQAMSKNIKIVAGVDAGASGAGYVPHGMLHKELELFVHHGMTEYEALKTATINASELLNLKNKIGSIEIGKYADMVILNSNPIKNIKNLTDINLVIKEGQIVKW